FSIDYAYFPLDYYPDLQKQLKAYSSTFKMLREHYNIQFCSAHKEISYGSYASAKADFVEIKLLKAQIYNGLAIVKRSITDQTNRVVHFSKFCLPADQVSFSLEIRSSN
ncbi:MAG: UTRA domain-containing protein, partial [Eubacteriales bacterium]|nr:UTRA domain-containing protein [Eubacteriales bacterium]